MSQIDNESQVTSEDQDAGMEKLVPVKESIHYRKRAQAAEKQVGVLEQQLRETAENNRSLLKQLEESGLERELVTSLLKAGVSDLETAMLLAKSKMKEQQGQDVEAVIGRLVEEKGYLFTAGQGCGGGNRTASVKDHQSGGRNALEGRAKKAARSGSRADLQEYLRVRRQFV